MVLIVGDSTLNSAPSSLEEFFETSLEVWFNFNIISYHRQHNHQLTHPRQHCIGEGVQSSNILLCKKLISLPWLAQEPFFPIQLSFSLYTKWFYFMGLKIAKCPFLALFKNLILEVTSTYHATVKNFTSGVCLTVFLWVTIHVGKSGKKIGAKSQS